MQIRECTDDDVVSLLLLASDDKDMDFLDNWAQYQRWLLDAVYKKDWQVLIADDGFGVVGFLVWELVHRQWKDIGYLNYVYVSEDFRKTDTAAELVKVFIPAVYDVAEECRFQSKVLPQEWLDFVSLNVPHKKFTTYHIPKTDELERWYNDIFQRK
jgi:hypothetical protein